MVKVSMDVTWQKCPFPPSFPNPPEEASGCLKRHRHRAAGRPSLSFSWEAEQRPSLNWALLGALGAISPPHRT